MLITLQTLHFNKLIGLLLGRMLVVEGVATQVTLVGHMTIHMYSTETIYVLGSHCARSPFLTHPLIHNENELKVQTFYFSLRVFTYKSGERYGNNRTFYFYKTRLQAHFS